MTILRAKKVRCLLCTPMCRAAKRLTVSISLAPRTSHRLPEIDSETGRFTRNESSLLACVLLVVETSMVDGQLMHSLLRASPHRSGLVLVGDVDEIPSVGPGTVLHDLVESRVVRVVRLTELSWQTGKRATVGSSPQRTAGVRITTRSSIVSSRAWRAGSTCFATNTFSTLRKLLSSKPL